MPYESFKHDSAYCDAFKSSSQVHSMTTLPGDEEHQVEGGTSLVIAVLLELVTQSVLLLHFRF